MRKLKYKKIGVLKDFIVTGHSEILLRKTTSASVNFKNKNLFIIRFRELIAGSKYMGLAEKFMVSEYQIYYFVTSLMVFLRN